MHLLTQEFDFTHVETSQFGSTVGPAFLCWMVLNKKLYCNLEESPPTPSDGKKYHKISEFSNEEVQNHLPPIDVSVKIYQLRNIDTRDNTFEADFNVIPGLQRALAMTVFFLFE